MTEENQITETSKHRLITILNDQDTLLLRERSEPVSFAVLEMGQLALDKTTSEAIKALKDYVSEHNGLGMAAIQLGVKLRLFVMRRPWNSNKIITVINPKILNGEGKAVKAEGCFSVPLPQTVNGGLVERMSFINVSYENENGEQIEDMLVGMDARIFQHELDHLNGKLFLDGKKFRGWAT